VNLHEELENTLFDDAARLYEMGRPRQDMIDKINSLIDTVQEHLWKLYAYGNVRINDISGWTVSLNKHLNMLRKYNVQRKGNGRKNLTKKGIGELTATMFSELDDLKVLNDILSSNGFPSIKFTEKDRKKLVAFSNEYFMLVFTDSGKFSMDRSKMKKH